MNIGVVGLGLMGGSIARAVRAYTPYSVAAADANADVLARATRDGTVDMPGDPAACDVVFVCLNPRDAVAYMRGTRFRAGAIVTDICGVKRYVADAVSGALHSAGVRYVGGHPMAGKEVSGYAASEATLFRGASYVLVRDAHTQQAAVDTLRGIVEMLGCTVTISTPDEHDRMIAYTSQLAHAVSNAYIKNPLSQRAGFSAGSFMDMTRVAKLDPAMWAELFVENADYLSTDIGHIIGELDTLRRAIDARDEPTLRALLQKGSDMKTKA